MIIWRLLKVFKLWSHFHKLECLQTLIYDSSWKWKMKYHRNVIKVVENTKQDESNISPGMKNENSIIIKYSKNILKIVFE